MVDKLLSVNAGLCVFSYRFFAKYCPTLDFTGLFA